MFSGCRNGWIAGHADHRAWGLVSLVAVMLWTVSGCAYRKGAPVVVHAYDGLRRPVEEVASIYLPEDVRMPTLDDHEGKYACDIDWNLFVRYVWATEVRVTPGWHCFTVQLWRHYGHGYVWSEPVQLYADLKADSVYILSSEIERAPHKLLLPTGPDYWVPRLRGPLPRSPERYVARLQTEHPVEVPRVLTYRDFTDRVAETLKLTPEQRTRYDAIVEEYRLPFEERAAKKEEMVKLLQLMRQKTAAQKASDNDGVAEIERQIDELLAEGRAWSDAFFGKVSQLLTPEQVGKLDDFIETMGRTDQKPVSTPNPE